MKTYLAIAKSGCILNVERLLCGEGFVVEG